MYLNIINSSSQVNFGTNLKNVKMAKNLLGKVTTIKPPFAKAIVVSTVVTPALLFTNSKNKEGMSVEELNGRTQTSKKETISGVNNTSEPKELSAWQIENLNILKEYFEARIPCMKITPEDKNKLLTSLEKASEQCDFEPFINDYNVLLKKIEKLLGKNSQLHKSLNAHFRKLIKDYNFIMRTVSDDIKNLSINERKSLAVAEAWEISGLKKDWKSLITTDWRLAKLIYAKRKDPESKYNTYNLINAYFSHFTPKVKSGNPIAEKWKDQPTMNESKQRFLKSLYKIVYSTDPMWDVRPLIGTPAYKNFDIEGMADSIEKLEQHYINAFMYDFWSSQYNRQTFSEALKEAYRRYEIPENEQVYDKRDIMTFMSISDINEKLDNQE